MFTSSAVTIKAAGSSEFIISVSSRGSFRVSASGSRSPTPLLPPRFRRPLALWVSGWDANGAARLWRRSQTSGRRASYPSELPVLITLLSSPCGGWKSGSTKTPVPWCSPWRALMITSWSRDGRTRSLVPRSIILTTALIWSSLITIRSISAWMTPIWTIPTPSKWSIPALSGRRTVSVSWWMRQKPFVILVSRSSYGEREMSVRS